LLQVFELHRAADVANQILPRIELQKAAAGVAGVALQGRHQLLHRDAELRHARRVGLHLVLAHLAANGHHLGHAWDGEQAWAQHEVGVLPRGHGADLLGVDGQRHQHDLAHDGTDRPHGCVLHPGRQGIARRGEALVDDLPRAVDVGAPIKGHVHKSEADGRYRTHRRHARQPAHGLLQRQGHELLHLLGRHAAGFDLQRHLRAVEAREHIDRCAREREGAKQHHGQRHGEHQQPISQAALQ
jgi:hypothetical protein